MGLCAACCNQVWSKGNKGKTTWTFAMAAKSMITHAHHTAEESLQLHPRQHSKANTASLHVQTRHLTQNTDLSRRTKARSTGPRLGSSIPTLEATWPWRTRKPDLKQVGSGLRPLRRPGRLGLAQLRSSFCTAQSFCTCFRGPFSTSTVRAGSSDPPAPLLLGLSMSLDKVLHQYSTRSLLLSSKSRSLIRSVWPSG